VLERLGEQDISAQAASVPDVRRLPACRFLPDAVAASLLSVPDLAAAIAALEDDLHWKQNPQLFRRGDGPARLHEQLCLCRDHRCLKGYGRVMIFC
jgi:hypothetical protein